MSHLKVNFEITSVNNNFGVAYVKYWADGATAERFGADIGPYEIAISPECATMTDQEFLEYIAKFGVGIVKRQKDALDAESLGVITKFETIVNTEANVTVELTQTANT